MIDFYLGSPIEPEDLWFRDEFIDQLWQTLNNEHVVLSAPRRTNIPGAWHLTPYTEARTLTRVNAAQAPHASINCVESR